MIRAAGLVLLALAAADGWARPAIAPPTGRDGGKVQWRPGRDHDAALAEAKAYGIPLWVCFTTDKDPACRKANEGPLSDPDVVKVSERVIRLLINSAHDPKLFERYKVKAVPYHLFLDAEGDVIRTAPGDLGAAALSSMILEVAEGATRGPRWMETADAALQVGKNDHKIVLLVFPDEKKDAQTFIKTFGDGLYKGIWTKFAASKLPFSKDSEDCKRWKVTEPSTVLLLEAGEGEPRVLKTIKGPKSPKELKKDLEEVLKKFEGGK